MVGMMALAGLLGVARASNHAVIIQGWLPTEASCLDWAPEGLDTLDELWNDCALMFEHFYNRPAVDSDPSRIHMLWAEGNDYWRQGPRYKPEWIDSLLHHLTDDTADIPHISACFESLAAVMDSTDTLFCYTWGHGGHDRYMSRNSSHFSIKVRPIWGNPGNRQSTPLWDTAFARMADSVTAQRVFVMQQCHGGGFIDDLADDRTIMICAGATGEKTYSCDNMIMRLTHHA